MRLSDKELAFVYGGGITASLLNAVSRAISTTLNLGQIIGTAIKRALSKNYCK